MIIHCQSGAVLVLNECPFTPGAYLSVGNQRGSQGAIVTPAELDQVRAELDLIAARIADRSNPKQERAA